MRMNLKVPFAEKDEAKKLGARWDAARKLWYIDDKTDVAAFSRWAPTPHEVATGAGQVAKRGSTAAPATSGLVQVGSRYIERPRVCECLPWEDCEACRAQANQAA
ncbi:MAG: hypothetical protein JNK52_14105 [Zoogloeaceae bacterium]|nr:hypothetical protein [Zoogloeaceae bacterium]